MLLSFQGGAVLQKPYTSYNKNDIAQFGYTYYIRMLWNSGTLTTYHELKQKAPARASLDNGTQAGIKHNRNKTNRCRADRPDMNNRL